MAKDDGSLTKSAVSAGGTGLQVLGIGAILASFHPASGTASGFLLGGGFASLAAGLGMGFGNSIK